jgi:type IV secretory pathway TraG/TraD family ATPase VirD4
MRLFLSLGMSALYREDGVPVTVLIDEAYILGRHDEVTKALSILRKFNCRVSVIFQSSGQIDRLYPDDSDLFTSGSVMAFRASGEKSARAMSFRAGEEVVPSPSYSDPASPTDLRVKPSWSPHKRERIPAGMMFSIPRGKALVWLPGDDAPRISRVKGYFDIPELAARADPNPYYKGPAARSAPRRKWVLTAGVLLAAAALLRPVPVADGKPAGATMHNRAETAGNRAASRPEQRPARAVVNINRRSK